MNVLIMLLYVVEVIVAAMLIGIVLIQQSKSQGGLGALAGGMTESVFGAATGNVITKTTVTLATIFMVNTLVLAILTGKSSDSSSFGDRYETPASVPGETLDMDGMELPADDTSVGDGGAAADVEDAADQAADGASGSAGATDTGAGAAAAEDLGGSAEAAVDDAEKPVE